MVPSELLKDSEQHSELELDSGLDSELELLTESSRIFYLRMEERIGTGILGRWFHGPSEVRREV